MGCLRELTTSGGSVFTFALLGFPGAGSLQNPGIWFKACRVQWEGFLSKDLALKFFNFKIQGLKQWPCSRMQPKAYV